MTNDETQRKMDFIVDQRARFRADILRLTKRYSQAEKRFAKTEDILTRLDGAILRLTQENH